MSPRHPLLAILLGSIVFETVGCAHTEANLPEPKRSDEDVEKRLHFIERRLDAGTPAANGWAYGWLGIYGALTLGQFGGAVGTTDPLLRKDLAVGAFSSALGVLPFAIFPFTPRFASSKLARYSESTPSERRRKLAAGERLLRKSAEDEEFGHGWLTQVGNFGVNFAVGFLLAFAYDRPRSGVVSAVTGIGVGELQIFTQPMAAVDDWDAYKRGDFGSPRHQSKLRIEPMPSPGGIGIGAHF